MIYSFFNLDLSKNLYFKFTFLIIENSTLSYRRVSNFQIMRTTNAARNMAPETPKPIDKEFIGPGGHPIAEKNPKVQGKKSRPWFI